MTLSGTFPFHIAITLPQFIDSEEREAILKEIQGTHYNASKAARNLGLSFRALRYRMGKSGLAIRSEPRRIRIGAAGAFERAWPRLRMKVLRQYGARCQCCGATAKDGRAIHVDHILPRKTHPHLALDPSNLQVLCEPCNLSKSYRLTDDWR